jgi:hypothetical protein
MHGNAFFWEFFGQAAGIIIAITAVSAIIGKIFIKRIPDEGRDVDTK